MRRFLCRHLPSLSLASAIVSCEESSSSSSSERTRDKDDPHQQQQQQQQQRRPIWVGNQDHWTSSSNKGQRYQPPRPSGEWNKSVDANRKHLGQPPEAAAGGGGGGGEAAGGRKGGKSGGPSPHHHASESTTGGDDSTGTATGSTGASGVGGSGGGTAAASTFRKRRLTGAYHHEDRAHFPSPPTQKEGGMKEVVDHDEMTTTPQPPTRRTTTITVAKRDTFLYSGEIDGLDDALQDEYHREGFMADRHSVVGGGGASSSSPNNRNTPAVGELLSRRQSLRGTIRPRPPEIVTGTGAASSLAPFPSHVVGTYSCHGVEPFQPVLRRFMSNLPLELQLALSGMPQQQRPVSKINQDRGCVAHPYGNDARMALFAVFDGHGIHGEDVADFAMKQFLARLKRQPDFPTPMQGSSRTGRAAADGGGVGGHIKQGGESGPVSLDRPATAASSSSAVTSVVGGWGDHRTTTNTSDRGIVHAMKRTFLELDETMRTNHPEVPSTYSGSTACVVLLRKRKLYVSNLGDSRAVLARRHGLVGERVDSGSGGCCYTAIDLTWDQNPDIPGEYERIISSGGYVSPPSPSNGMVSRVWLDPEYRKLGLAMSRSVGDHALKSVGVSAEPVVTTHDLRPEDDFVVIATDGVWEFLSSSEVVDLVANYLDAGLGASEACEALIETAAALWRENEGDYRDDITAVVVRVQDLWPTPGGEMGDGNRRKEQQKEVGQER